MRKIRLREIDARTPLYPEEWNTIINEVNEPGDPLGIIDFSAVEVDSPGFYTSVIPTENISLSFTGIPGTGVVQSVLVTFDGDVTFTVSGAYIKSSDFTNGAAPDSGIWRVYWWYDGLNYEVGMAPVSQVGVIPPDTTPPTVTSQPLKTLILMHW